MQETDTPGPTTSDDGGLDRFEADFDHVAEALEALDADDLDAAEALVAGLDPVVSTEPVATPEGDPHPELA